MKKPYHSVAIRYREREACSAVKQFPTKLFLSAKASPFGETQRFLSREAPLLPLAECTVARCQCHYVHYADRRERDRRHAYAHWAALAFGETERRDRPSRRQNDWVTPPSFRQPTATD